MGIARPLHDTPARYLGQVYKEVSYGGPICDHPREIDKHSSHQALLIISRAAHTVRIIDLITTYLMVQNSIRSSILDYFVFQGKFSLVKGINKAQILNWLCSRDYLVLEKTRTYGVGKER